MGGGGGKGMYWNHHVGLCEQVGLSTRDCKSEQQHLGARVEVEKGVRYFARAG